EETIKLIEAGHSLEQIAKIRGRQPGSVVSLVAEMVERGALEFQPAWIGAGKQEQIEAVCSQHGMERLKPLKEALPPEVTFEEIRLVVARLRRNGGLPRET